MGIDGKSTLSIEDGIMLEGELRVRLPDPRQAAERRAVWLVMAGSLVMIVRI
jgi:hypothetical protein